MSSILTCFMWLFFIWIFIELLTWVLIKWLKPDFQWLIEKNDEIPDIDKELAFKYQNLSFHPDLGWVRKAGTKGVEKTNQGDKHFNIDDLGRRKNKKYETISSKIAVFGDSFSFCRLVNDDETWPYYLSELTNSHVYNFGVGNYGIDQAILRFEKELNDIDSSIIVIGVVPETISRIHSYWRHYFEYGNILAFKPRFTLENNKLIHHQQTISEISDLFNYKKNINHIRSLDYFYENKFKKDLLIFPYLLNLVKRYKRIIPIFWHLCTNKIVGDSKEGFKSAFNVVIQDNSRFTANLYSINEAQDLLSALILRFVHICEQNKKKPCLLIMPQPIDLDSLQGGVDDYRSFFQKQNEILPVLDLTNQFLHHKDISSLFIEGELGPHPSPSGNEFIAKELDKFIKNDSRFV